MNVKKSSQCWRKTSAVYNSNFIAPSSVHQHIMNLICTSTCTCIFMYNLLWTAWNYESTVYVLFACFSSMWQSMWPQCGPTRTARGMVLHAFFVPMIRRNLKYMAKKLRMLLILFCLFDYFLVLPTYIHSHKTDQPGRPMVYIPVTVKEEEEILKYGAKHASVVIIITILFVCLFACSTDQCGRKTDQPGRPKE